MIGQFPLGRRSFALTILSTAFSLGVHAAAADEKCLQRPEPACIAELGLAFAGELADVDTRLAHALVMARLGRLEAARSAWQNIGARLNGSERNFATLAAAGEILAHLGNAKRASGMFADAFGAWKDEQRSAPNHRRDMHFTTNAHILLTIAYYRLHAGDRAAAADLCLRALDDTLRAKSERAREGQRQFDTEIAETLLVIGLMQFAAADLDGARRAHNAVRSMAPTRYDYPHFDIARTGLFPTFAALHGAVRGRESARALIGNIADKLRANTDLFFSPFTSLRLSESIVEAQMRIGDAAGANRSLERARGIISLANSADEDRLLDREFLNVLVAAGRWSEVLERATPLIDYHGYQLSLILTVQLRRRALGPAVMTIRKAHEQGGDRAIVGKLLVHAALHATDRYPAPALERLPLPLRR